MKGAQRFAAILLCAGIAVTASAESVLGFEGEETATVGIYIKDLQEDKVIAEHNAGMAITPASTMKALTAATALSVLGPDFSFTTPVNLRGSRSGSAWHGDLVVNSVADPTLESEYFDKNLGFCDSVISHLRAMGIKSISGRVVVAETLKDAGPVPQWEIEDVAWSYGAALYGANWRDNVFRLWPATGRTQPHVPDLKVELHKDADGTDLLRGAGSNTLEVWGRDINNAKWSLTATMPYPAKVLSHELTERLRNAGVVVGGEKNASTARQESESVYVHKSPAASAILKSLLVRSDNMMAEGMLRAVSPSDNRKDVIKREKELWDARGISLKYCGILDGSGLSMGNKLTPRVLGYVLEWMARSPYGELYPSLLPRAGVNGTMKSFMAKTPLKGRLALKTGSVSAVQCYAGYLLDEDGKPTHVVVIMVNSFYCPRGRVREAISKYLLSTFNIETE
ncbi:MAG: D-alanyl-D-alanine carboxypeptidase/D-alanyl-D-alanine-endopeptidase [Muribaculaceae bacterium]|nr:D-alanyl-D-alanine carboxypeptidase/D-alanyl-D-alanine-endopeptidase [Muribaculaceae bacterium]